MAHEEWESSSPPSLPEGEIIGIHRADHDPPPVTTYFMQVNSAEIQRLEGQDATVTEAMKSLLPSVIDPASITHVLDVACGPGGWTRVLSRTYPHLTIEALDNSPMIIANALRLAREEGLTQIHYQISDILQDPLPYPDGTFDVVNTRFITSFVHRREWPRIVKEFVRVTKPGGWVVLTDADNAGACSSLAFHKFTEMGLKAMQQAGHFAGSQGVSLHLRHFLKQAGCLQTAMEPSVVDFSADKPEAHLAISTNMKAAMAGFRPFAITKGKLDPVTYDKLFSQFLREMEHPDFHGLWTIYRAWGRKPLR